MSMTVLPNISEVVRCVARALEEKIAPALTSVADRSALATSQHLLRYVATRLEIEGQCLWDEVAYAATLLQDATGFLELEMKTETAAALASEIRIVLAKRHDPSIYLTLSAMADQVGPLRALIARVLESILALHGEAAYTQRAAALHQAIRDYIGWQLLQESKFLEVSFRGQGARR